MNNKRILQKQIHFEHFPSLSFGPSKGHISVDIGTKKHPEPFLETREKTLYCGRYREQELLFGTSQLGWIGNLVFSNMAVLSLVGIRTNNL